MKNIYKLILSLAAILTLAPSVSAQNLKEGTYQKRDGVAYRKSVSGPNTDGSYTIKIESFVTGDVSATDESKPADIVLVLDISSSMNETYKSGVYTAVTANSTNVNQGYRPSNGIWDENTSQANMRYYKLDNEYHRVKLIKESTGETDPQYGYEIQNYNLFFDVSNDDGTTTRYYLDDTEITTVKPDKYHNNNDDIWKAPLYKYNSSSITKMEALRAAVYSFLEEVDHNDRIDINGQVRTTRLGNRVAIITYAGTRNGTASSTSDTWSSEFVYLGNEDKEITNVSGKQTLRNWVNNNVKQETYPTQGAGTFVEHGMERAKGLMNNSSAENKTVVMFTDGIPGDGTWYTAGFMEYYYDMDSNDPAVLSANRAIDDANSMKGNGVVLWTVGVFSGLDATDKVYTDRYMSRVSSDWSSNAPHMRYTTADPTQVHYKDVSTGGDLTSVFVEIAGVSGGSSSPATGSSSVTMDVVSNSFVLPANIKLQDGTVDLNKVKLYTAECNGEKTIDGIKYLKFGEEVLAGTRGPVSYWFLQKNENDEDEWIYRENVYIDRDLAPTVSLENNTISVSGFKYSELYCGYDDIKTKGYRGYKLIMEFPIEIAEDALGGAEVITNTEESGLYLNDDKNTFVPFNRPTAAVPVNLQLLKEGMEEGDVAHFTIERKLASDPNSAYAYYTTITLVGDPNNEVTKTFTDSEGNQASATGVLGVLRGLDPLYHYRIKEAGWAWTYDNQDRTQMSTEERDENPFVVKNDPDDPEIHNKEVSRRNVFTTTKVLVSPSN